MSQEDQSREITKEIRISDELIVGFAEHHGMPNPFGSDPDRMIDKRYITEATSFYHTLERLGTVPSLTKLNEAAEALVHIQDPIEKLRALKEYITTGKLSK